MIVKNLDEIKKIIVRLDSILETDNEVSPMDKDLLECAIGYLETVQGNKQDEVEIEGHPV